MVLKSHNPSNLRKNIRSAVEAWSKAAPGIPKWTKHTVAKHITLGGLGATTVGSPSQVADEFERWVEEADVDGFNIVCSRPFSHLHGSPTNIRKTGICVETRNFRRRRWASHPWTSTKRTVLERLCRSRRNISRELICYQGPDRAASRA